MALSIRKSDGQFRLVTPDELIGASDSELEAYVTFADLFAKRSDLEAQVIAAREKLAALQQKRNDAHAAVARLTPNAGAEAVFHARQAVATWAAVAAAERGQ